MPSFTAAVISRLASLSPVHKDMSDTESTLSSQGASSSSLEASSSTASYSARYTHDLTSSPVDIHYNNNNNELRRNEHLAVLLSKSLWKPDSQASRCDIFLCSRKFSVFERKHHCRKCGGVFCAECSTHTTPLLDASTLPFLNPPKSTPISSYASPESPVVTARVCDNCWDQIHGSKSPRSRALQQKKLEEAEQWEVESSSTGSSASSPRTPHTPLDSLPLTRLSARVPLRRAHTTTTTRPPPTRVNTLSSTASHSSSSSECASSELDAYPLCHASAICKVNGGGRWQPAPCVDVVGMGMAADEEDEDEGRMNGVVKDGDFQLWYPREVKPKSLAEPVRLSTF
ncbi:FYVE zinc finger-domain-containing protein [Irpex rosettiformis]|uniref:FYVE zinc finger-domain-containing protein n=1 Tax=Irpex rosettiformis TaxID=378272 RepID=A0ACB8U6J3_9APHY|nr:FYVE zinc finger-domain-containing protein [Irpex rosettiformis]